MATLQIKRDATVAIPFTISDPTGNLANKRVSWVVADAIGNAVLSKESAQPGSSAEVTITAQSSILITGTINITLADFVTLSKGSYKYTLWVDDSAGTQNCASPDGIDDLVIIATVPRI